MNNKKISDYLLENQEVAVILYLIALFIMFYLANNRLNNPDKNVNDLALFNKFLIIGVYLYFIYISYVAYKNSNSKLDYIALISSVIAAIPPFIILFLFLEAQGDQSTLNPQL